MKKHIYIYSPSGAVRDKAAFRRGVKRLQAQGHEVEIDVAVLVSHQRFAGDDATRLAAIERACDSGADVALISRGGYGLTRILPGINYKKIAKSIERGMLFVGISDFTAFQNAVLAKTGALTWAGPALCEGFGAPDGPDEIMQACFDDLLCGQGEGTGWQQLRGTDQPALHVQNATLWGGNLAVLTSLLGTPYFPDIRNGVLFLEDVCEHPYRIERMLTQLLHAGVLKRQKAIVMGQFTEYSLTPHDRGFRLSCVMAWLKQQVNVPVLTNLPYGHVQTKVLLPVGSRVELAAQDRDVLMAWGHL
ncbi:MAG: LD-carboxypeptidase [Rhodoferax sp.]|nr:LD-carboxypeptidase [Rhodoferax sp.]OIP25381.1 MAG: LD-carboxypeptidase [Comamonadaceae bacterium CG2_30_60_41]PIW09311.1 MAG: LD-carboxypeptidase [Comamonadaceae bacterium CG17_big_fil_post_rev_8_21_14_2_50_60_13]PIY26129.1 MAG: LD-carboxypeptidase [Comamonadaceae bacterium CG_4_10_14_3_um_filter_60_75]PJC12378.1 MAG: LD-carboxypeptidase [Comamonadaceae bacterium CG_4_9_14_0_8_um_filter_60_18]